MVVLGDGRGQEFDAMAHQILGRTKVFVSR